MRKIIAVCFVIMMLMGGIIGFVNLSTNAENGNGDDGTRYASKSGLTAHDPIYINGNSQFTPTYGVTGGSGTKSDPYVIEGWDINASSTNGIYIENTDAYFVIRNCVIHDGGTTYDGIYFSFVTNGKINNITSYNNYYGIKLVCSSNNKITSNQIYNNYYGIWLYWSSNNNTITNCNVYNNTYYEIFLEAYFDSGCDYNQITNCAVHNKGHGIYLESSNNNQITNCVVYNTSGIELYSSSNNQITNCDIYNNFNGISLKYSLYMGSSSDNHISKCKVYNNSNDGIYLDSFSDNNEIIDCTIYSNSNDGIYLDSYSDNNNISNCEVYNNSCGINLTSSSNIEVHYCNIYGNTDYGIYNCASQPKYRVYATDNWWGSADGPSGVGTGNGDNVSGNVLYDPWLTKSVTVTTTNGDEEGEEGEGGNALAVCFTIVIVIVVVIIVAVIMLTRRRRVLPPRYPPTTPPSQPLYTPPPMPPQPPVSYEQPPPPPEQQVQELQPISETSVARCPQCGALLGEDAVFCEKCGTRVDTLQ